MDKKSEYFQKIMDQDYISMKIDDFIHFEKQGQKGALARLLVHMSSYVEALTDEMLKRVVEAFDEHNIDIDINLSKHGHEAKLKERIDQYRATIK